MSNVKESKEAVIGIIVIGGLVAAELKDGFQFPGDLLNIWNKIQASPEKLAKLEAAVKGIQLAPAEIKAANFAEYLELLMAALNELPGAINSLKV